MVKNESFQVVVLLGGKGTRLSSIEPHLPKPMVNVWGKPFLYYQVQLMRLSGFRNFVFCIGHKADIIKKFFGDGNKFGVDIKYSYDGHLLLGTGGAVRKALPLLKEDFLLMYGDSYMDIDYSELIYMYFKFKREQNKTGLMAVFRNRNKYDKSNVVFKDGRLLKYDKRNQSSHMEYIDYGISILNRSIVEEIPKIGVTDISEVYQRLVSKGWIAGYEVRNRFYEIGRPLSLREFKEFIRRRTILKKPAIFLDRDGTLNKMVLNDGTGEFDSPLKEEQFKLLPKVAHSLRILKSMGYRLIVVTNQPAAAKGKVTLADIYGVNNRFKDILMENNVYLDDVLICPHHSTGTPYTKERFLISNCKCRKPKAGLLRLASQKFNIDLENSYMVGDSPRDILTGKTIGIKTVFLGGDKCRRANHTFDSLYEFVAYLKKKDKKHA